MTVELVLIHDTNKELKGGKRRYGDSDGHNLYLSGDEVDQLGAPSGVRVSLEPINSVGIAPAGESGDAVA